MYVIVQKKQTKDGNEVMIVPESNYRKKNSLRYLFTLLWYVYKLI